MFPRPVNIIQNQPDPDAISVIYDPDRDLTVYISSEEGKYQGNKSSQFKIGFPNEPIEVLKEKKEVKKVLATLVRRIEKDDLNELCIVCSTKIVGELLKDFYSTLTIKSI